MGSSELVDQYQSKVYVRGSCLYEQANHTHRHLTFIGSAIIAMMLLFDPFLQQIVVYPERLVESDKIATIVRAQRYQARSYEGLPLPSVVDISMKVISEGRYVLIVAILTDLTGSHLQRSIRH